MNKMQLHAVTHDDVDRRQVKEFIFNLVAENCALPTTAISEKDPFYHYGFDSIIAMQINQEVSERFNVELPFADIVNGMTVAGLVDYIVSSVNQNESRFKIPEGLVVEKANKNRFNDLADIPQSLYDIANLAQYKKISVRKTVFNKAGIHSPYFRPFSSEAKDTIVYEEKPLVNFATYNYLGLSGDEGVKHAAKEAIDRYGTSASSSRLVSGEKNAHRELECAIAGLYSVEAAITFVSGYQTNVTVLAHLMGERDLILYDSLSHNSILTGVQLSKAKGLAFKHNDIDNLQQLLEENRRSYEKVLIVIEGLYSMHGDTPDLTSIVTLKKRFKCLLMVDEAHSLGVLGHTGLGLREHANVPSTDVDIWMGTLSKTLASCGGYVAGCRQLINELKHGANGFIFSVAMAPAMAEAANAAIKRLKEEPRLVKSLQENSRYFYGLAEKEGLNLGLAEGHAIIPIIIGNSIKTVDLANRLFDQGINVQPIIYPGVNEHEARLRFFISTTHTKQQIEKSINLLVNALKDDDSPEK